MRVGIVGCGNISRIYLENLQKRFTSVTVTAVSDIVTERAQETAESFSVPNVLSVDDLVSHPDVDIVLNLTNPATHAQICIKALEAGKHTFTEKPLAVDFKDGQRMVSLAAEKSLAIGCAPDTFLGGGLQTCRKILDDGVIGEPVAATAFMLSRGPEKWHPNPYPFYQPGAGPLFDMGPYYITALVHLLGPVVRLSAATRVTFPERTAGHESVLGQKIPVNTPTHVAGNLEFASGAIATLITSFDIWKHRLPRIDLHGTEGSLAVPDPNTFGGPVSVFTPDKDDWAEVELTHGYAENSRGIGLLDMATGVSKNRGHRASGDLSLHVLEVMHGLLESGRTGSFYAMATTCGRPAALPTGLADGDLE